MPTPHDSQDRRAPHEKAQHGGKRERTPHDAADQTEQLIFTLNAATGEVIKIEKIDPAGKRSEVPKAEALERAGKENLHEIETALDEAIEAGVCSMFNDNERENEPTNESDEEISLRRVLLTGLVGRDVRRRLHNRLVQRLILARTLEH